MNKFAKEYRKRADKIMNDSNLTEKQKMDEILKEAIKQTKAKAREEGNYNGC